MGKKKRSASSSRWLNEHFKDPFVQKAHKQKLRSRAYFKLDEIQQTDKLFKPGMTGLIATSKGIAGLILDVDRE